MSDDPRMAEAVDAFQSRVNDWMLKCFGVEISRNKTERNHRFLEEALELVQSCDCTQSEAHELVDYVFGRPIGEPRQEVGGVMVTLAALCVAHGFDMAEAGDDELTRVWTKKEQIRAKQAAKPKNSPLPMAAPTVLGRPEINEPRRGETWSAAHDKPSYPEWTPAKDALLRFLADRMKQASHSAYWKRSERIEYEGLHEAAFPDPAREG